MPARREPAGKGLRRLCAALLALAMLPGLSACTRQAPEPVRATAETAQPEPEQSLPVILTQPRAKPGAVGADLFLSVEAQGEDLRYLWQYRSGETGEWKACGREGFDTPNYTVRLKKHHEGYQFRCRITAADGETFSEPVTLHLIERPYVSQQPESQSAAAGDRVSFTVLAGGGGLKYQWYFRKSVKGRWIACAGEGCRTGQYSLTVKGYHDGYQYRCVISNGLGKAVTQVVTLKLEP